MTRSYLGKDCDPDAVGTCGSSLIPSSGLECTPSTVAVASPPPPAPAAPVAVASPPSSAPPPCWKTAADVGICKGDCDAAFDDCTDTNTKKKCGKIQKACKKKCDADPICRPSPMRKLSIPKPPATCQPK